MLPIIKFKVLLESSIFLKTWIHHWKYDNFLIDVSDEIGGNTNESNLKIVHNEICTDVPNVDIFYLMKFIQWYMSTFGPSV